MSDKSNCQPSTSKFRKIVRTTADVGAYLSATAAVIIADQIMREVRKNETTEQRNRRFINDLFNL